MMAARRVFYVPFTTHALSSSSLVGAGLARPIRITHGTARPKGPNTGPIQAQPLAFEHSEGRKVLKLADALPACLSHCNVRLNFKNNFT